MTTVRPTPRLLKFGDGAMLVEFAALHEVLDLNRALESDRPLGVTDVIPAARTLLVQFETEVITYQQVSRWVLGAGSGAAVPAESAAVTIPVRYDGPDLAWVAQTCSLTPEQVIARHCESEYTVGFSGFAPGFAYLVGLPASLHVPRRSSPRTKVPAGSVGLAGEFTGIYPADSPGGWQLIGTTDLAVFDINREPPALLVPGTRVRFVAAT